MYEFNKDSKEITPNLIFELLPKLLSNEKEKRIKAEKFLEQNTYNPLLYQNLIEIGLYNNTISDNEKLQIFILLRKLIKDNLLYSKLASTPLKMKTAFEENSDKIELIINNLKLHLKSYLNKGDFTQNYNKILRDIVCIISGKYFPYKWVELNSYYKEFFEFDPNKALSVKYFQVALYISNMFYTTMKNFDNKNKYNANFEEFKICFTNSYMKYYNNIKDLFVHHPNGIINDSVNEKCFKLMAKNDKILILLIRFNFSINNFKKDSITIELVNILIERIKNLLMMFEKIKVKAFKNILEQNIFKVLEHIVMIIQKDPIIFCFHIDQIIQILSAMLKNCNLFQRDTTKVVLFNLSKILPVQIYKENIELNIETFSQRKNTEEISYVTPRKPKGYTQNSNILKTPLHSIASPSKYKNLNKELSKANELYKKSMSKENIISLLECIINKIPFIYKNENEDTEIEILSHFQEDKSSNRDTFSTDTMTFESLKQNFLDQLLINFTDIIMQFVSDNLKSLYNIICIFDIIQRF